MTDTDKEESLTTLNTQLNKSMVLMDTTIETEMLQPKSNKTIKINTQIQSTSPSKTSTSRKSILKKTNAKVNKSRNSMETQNAENEEEMLIETNENQIPTNTSIASRPHTIDDLAKSENLIVQSRDSTFNLDDISDSEDIWVMDIPRTIDPRELKGQTLAFGKKSKFKIGEEKYCAINHDIKSTATCVFNTGKVNTRYRAINLKSAGAITIRRKFSSALKIEPMQIEDTTVPYPANLKIRHPLFGVNYEGKVTKGAIK